ncbi:MAG: nodulation protein NfeD [Actinobacteria bacterium]|nr:nodulation protein NfeD [Actinomycetota bacterium]
MREIVQNMLTCSMPVIVFVYPEGARAASAGVFIAYASDIAVMAPATSIGAAHPVNLGTNQQLSDEVMEKVVNDSVSFIKNLAQTKGRNPEWAEKAVRESQSITYEEALELKVIDFVAKDYRELLSKIDGLNVEKHGKVYLLSGKDAKVENLQMGFLTRFLHVISDPNIAYILLSLGVLAIIYEFSQPGLGVSGAIGTLFILLSMYSLSILPINYAGLGLIILAIILFILDFAIGTGGALSIPAIISLVIGSFILINTEASYLKIARSLIIGASLVIGGFCIIVIRAFHKIRRKKPVTGIQGMLGETAVVIETLKPEGLVRIHGEIWKAVSENGDKIGKGEKVIVNSSKGLTLYVKRVENKVNDLS